MRTPGPYGHGVTSDALPVRLRVGGPHAAAIRRYVDTLGWQPVEDDATAALVPPRLTLADVAGGPSADDPAVVLLVAAGDDAAECAAAAARCRPVAVLRWPAERDRLRSLVPPTPGSGGGPRHLDVGGAAGGVGTTTVTLALGGVLAWAGRPTLVVAAGTIPVPELLPVTVEDLSGPTVWAAAAEVPGVAALRVVRTLRPPTGVEVTAAGPEVVLRDVGVATDVDVLVLRRDRAGLEALAATTAAVVVVFDDGLVSGAALRRAARGRRLVVLPRSARVARAAVVGRVPASLPGSYLRAVAGVLRGQGVRGGQRGLTAR